MEIFFQDPDDIPLPPEQIRIRTFDARPYPDGRRVRVRLEITPFQERPNAEISIVNASGELVANISVVETLTPKMEFTMHLRSPDPRGRFTANGVVFYHQSGSFDFDTGAEDRLPHPDETNVLIVAQAKTEFDIPESEF